MQEVEPSPVLGIGRRVLILASRLGIVGRTLSSAADGAGLGGIAGFNEGNSLQDRASIGQGARRHVPNAGKNWYIPELVVEIDFWRALEAPGWCMMKRFLFAAIVSAVPVCLVLAQDAKVSVDMIGIGGMSCARWRSTKEHILEGTVWIYGFWTGLNYVAAASGQSPAKINMSAIVVEVEKTCARQASQTFASAVWTTYLGSKK